MFNKYSPELSSLTSNEGALETVLTKRPERSYKLKFVTGSPLNVSTSIRFVTGLFFIANWSFENSVVL